MCNHFVDSVCKTSKNLRLTLEKGYLEYIYIYIYITLTAAYADHLYYICRVRQTAVLSRPKPVCLKF